MRLFRSLTVRNGFLVAVLALGTAASTTLPAAQEAKLLPGDGAVADNFGRSVVLAGDVAMVGATYDDDNGQNSGSVYVFTHSAGAWTQESKLLPSKVQDFLLFGDAMALDGDTVIIGAWGDDQNGDHAGSAYVFTRVGGEWVEHSKLTPDDPDVDDDFGFGVALDGDTALIGAPGGADNGFGSGAAYVFTRTAGVWTQQAKLLPDDGASSDLFGEAVAVDGDTALIGARSNDENADNAGAAYVFTRTAGVWAQQAKLLSSDGSDSDNLGQSLALDGDTALVGAFGDDSARGSAYVFTRVGTLWTEKAKLIPADGMAEDQFGVSVALEGNTALIGALRDDDNGVNSGSVFVFGRNADEWVQQAKLTPTDGSTGDLFGFPVALDGDAAVIGAIHDNDNGGDSGSAYVFRPLENEPVPAHGRIGTGLLVLTILGTGAYLVRQRTARDEC